MQPTPTDSTPIRILLVDDHKSMLWGLDRLIASDSPRMEVVGKASSREDIFLAVAQAEPDLILLDIDLNGESVIPYMAEIQRRTAARILILTGLRDPEIHQQAILAGAKGVVMKDVPAEVILTAITRVHAGEVWLDRGSIAKLLDNIATGRSQSAPVTPDDNALSGLTRKERSILATLAAHPGAPNKTVAAKLFISEHTLRNHLTTIFSKIGVKNRFELTMFCLKHKDELGIPGNN